MVVDQQRPPLQGTEGQDAVQVTQDVLRKIREHSREPTQPDNGQERAKKGGRKCEGAPSDRVRSRNQKRESRRDPDQKGKADRRSHRHTKKKRRRTLSEFEKPLFSPRLEKRVLKLACGATLLEYFKSDGEVLEVSDAACRFAKEVFDREIKTRMLESN